MKINGILIGKLLGLTSVLVLLSGCAKQEIVTENTPEIQGKIVATGDVQISLLDIVATHANASSCWTVISGSVYDMTSWIGKHPGGDKAILASCGIDSTEMFDDKHGMDPKKWEGLENFKVMVQ